MNFTLHLKFCTYIIFETFNRHFFLFMDTINYVHVNVFGYVRCCSYFYAGWVADWEQAYAKGFEHN